MLAPDNAGTEAYLFLDADDKPVGLDAAKLDALRKCLPKVEFIKSELAMSDQIPIGVLLAGYGVQGAEAVFDYRAAQQAAALVHSLRSQMPTRIFRRRQSSNCSTSRQPYRLRS